MCEQLSPLPRAPTPAQTYFCTFGSWFVDQWLVAPVTRVACAVRAEPSSPVGALVVCFQRRLSRIGRLSQSPVQVRVSRAGAPRVSLGAQCWGGPGECVRPAAGRERGQGSGLRGRGPRGVFGVWCGVRRGAGVAAGPGFPPAELCAGGTPGPQNPRVAGRSLPAVGAGSCGGPGLLVLAGGGRGTWIHSCQACPFGHTFD